MTLSVGSVKEVTWWCENIEKLYGKPIQSKPADFQVEHNASNDGWGAHFYGHFTGWRLNTLESSCHINHLELLATFLALKSCISNNTKSLHVGIISNNSLALAYINNMGGITSELLDSLAIKNWNW